MAVIDIQDENLTEEKENIKSLKSSIDTLVEDIEQRIQDLKTAWQDEKSGTYLNTISLQMADLKKSNNDAKISVDAYFEEIIQQVKVYTEE